jgi:hypothetical protein
VDKQGDLFSDFFLILKVMQTTTALWRTENNKQGYSFSERSSLTRILISTFKSKYHGSNRYNRNRRKPLQVKNKID